MCFLRICKNGKRKSCKSKATMQEKGEMLLSKETMEGLWMTGILVSLENKCTIPKACSTCVQVTNEFYCAILSDIIFGSGLNPTGRPNCEVFINGTVFAGCHRVILWGSEEQGTSKHESKRTAVQHHCKHSTCQQWVVKEGER